MPNLTDSEIMADEYRKLVKLRTGIKSDDLVCPREKSEMTPCIARDGHLAVVGEVGSDVCVGCEYRVEGLVVAERLKHKAINP